MYSKERILKFYVISFILNFWQKTSTVVTGCSPPTEDASHWKISYIWTSHDPNCAFTIFCCYSSVVSIPGDRWTIISLQIDEATLKEKIPWRSQSHFTGYSIQKALFTQPSQNCVDEIDVVLHSWLETTFGWRTIWRPIDFWISYRITCVLQSLNQSSQYTCASRDTLHIAFVHMLLVGPSST